MTADDVAGVPAIGESVRVPTSDTMRALGKQFSIRASEGDVIALYGEPGTGKTEFVRGFVDDAGEDSDLVSSPTFTLIHEYSWRIPVYHFDAYRIEDENELIDLGLDEYLFGDGVCLIEWPGVIEHLLPENTIRLKLAHLPGGARSVTRES